MALTIPTSLVNALEDVERSRTSIDAPHQKRLPKQCTPGWLKLRDM
jgi:hypothetical protein